MIKYYNSNQVHKYGYRPQVKIPTTDESKKIIEKMLKKQKIRVDKIGKAWYNIDTIKRKKEVTKMKLMNIYEFMDKIWDEKGSDAWEDFENTLIEAWSLDDDGETFYKILEDNGIQINEDGNELKLEHNLQEWLWEGEDAGWFD